MTRTMASGREPRTVLVCGLRAGLGVIVGSAVLSACGGGQPINAYGFVSGGTIANPQTTYTADTVTIKQAGTYSYIFVSDDCSESLPDYGGCALELMDSSGQIVIVQQPASSPGSIYLASGTWTVTPGTSPADTFTADSLPVNWSLTLTPP
jgi:hypothetical protein